MFTDTFRHTLTKITLKLLSPWTTKLSIQERTGSSLPSCYNLWCWALCLEATGQHLESRIQHWQPGLLDSTLQPKHRLSDISCWNSQIISRTARGSCPHYNSTFHHSWVFLTLCTLRTQMLTCGGVAMRSRRNCGGISLSSNTSTEACTPTSMNRMSSTLLPWRLVI